MENSLRMVLSSCLLEDPLNLDLPFILRLSSMLDQMRLQAVKQRQITDNWQKQGPDHWLRTIKAVPVPMPLHSPLAEIFQISGRFSFFPLLLEEHFQSCSYLLSLQLFFFFSKLDGSTNMQPKVLDIEEGMSGFVSLSSGWDGTQNFLCSRRIRASGSCTDSNLKTQLQGNTSKWNARFVLAEDAVFPMRRRQSSRVVHILINGLTERASR